MEQGGVGAEIILGANDPSKPEGRVKIDPTGQFIIFNSNQPAVLDEDVVFAQAGPFIAKNRATHGRQILKLAEKLEKEGGLGPRWA